MIHNTPNPVIIVKITDRVKIAIMAAIKPASTVVFHIRMSPASSRNSAAAIIADRTAVGT